MAKQNLENIVESVKDAIDPVAIKEVIDNQSVPEVAPVSKVDGKELAAKYDAIYIEPTKKMTPYGKLDEKWKKDHAHDWERVVGIYENFNEPGSAVRFWYLKWPGDPDCFWVIPANKPVCIPRMIAKHLEECDKYHKFGFVDKPVQEWHPDDFTSRFMPVSTHYRSRFRPINTFG